jgi:hypothetical protein
MSPTADVRTPLVSKLARRRDDRGEPAASPELRERFSRRLARTLKMLGRYP